MDATVYIGPIIALLSALIIIGIITSLITVIYRANTDYHKRGKSRPPIFFRSFYRKAFDKESAYTQDLMDEAIKKLIEEEEQK